MYNYDINVYIYIYDSQIVGITIGINKTDLTINGGSGWLSKLQVG